MSTLSIVIAIIFAGGIFYLINVIRAYRLLGEVTLLIQERDEKPNYIGKDQVTDLLMKLNEKSTSPFYFLGSYFWSLILKSFDPAYYNIVTKLSQQRMKTLENSAHDKKIYEQLIKINSYVSIVPPRVLVLASYESVIAKAYATVSMNEVKKVVSAMNVNGNTIEVIQSTTVDYEEPFDEQMLEIYTNKLVSETNKCN